ncbi:KilA-N domain-containing protein [Acidaminobacter hydrogenoformans]|uniref:KilA-N domain-containing protein n=1 Tax=Acidaminobacter hydrogenoformans DSM 2784 TaxID=1120920 RepID=A0A1G5S6C5_9FIRM|nr:KilA-N domain-containing protein [Acidaminobacter hydrogenoformans]SCZ81119.1 KilA-N domain-containing protein [Acidaminobacter hydrogenoformans DSM 2784]
MSKKPAKEVIHAKGFDISIYTEDFQNEYISLTDIARYKSDEPNDVIKNWMRNRDTIEFLGLWENLNNQNFKPVEFDGFRKEAGLNAFTMSPTKWINTVNAIGIVSKSGRYGGTFAHSDIAFEFASWISAEFKLYIIKDYKRLKTDESSRLSLSWNLNREISKLNYRIHTNAIKENLLPQELTAYQISTTYASEADVLNVALFGMTAKQWRDENVSFKGNIRDYATLNQLLVLANMESYNAILIEQGKPQAERLQLLNKLAIRQLKAIEEIGTSEIKTLESE